MIPVSCQTADKSVLRTQVRALIFLLSKIKKIRFDSLGIEALSHTLQFANL